jgi:predicted ATPase
MPRHGGAFVGREEELAFLAARRRETARGPQFILVSGEAGVGKSRLLAEFRRTLQHRPVFVGYGECRDVAPVPFGPFISIFKTLVPELARGLAVASTSADRGEQEKGVLFDAARDAVERLGARRTTVLFLEDIHLADGGTLELLTHLARGVHTGRILMFTTYRSEPLHADERLLAAVARLVRLPDVSTLDLPPLTETEARTLVAVSVPDTVRLEAEILDAVVARAEGNAFFLEELVKSAVDRARRGMPSDEIPNSIQSVILERLAALSPGDRRVLAHAAVLGRWFDIELLCRVLKVKRADLLPSLRRARDANLILEGPPGSLSFSFRHGLTREAIVNDMLFAERRLLHADILDMLEALPVEDRQRYISDLAHHAFEAGDHPKAARYNEEAGDKAVGVNAYDDAAQHYERAITAMAPSHPGRRALYRKAGDSLFWAGHFERAVRTYQTALELAVAASDVAEAGRIHLQIARQYYLRENSTDAMASARRAIDVLTPNGPRALRDLAALTLAALHVFRLEVAAASELLGGIQSPNEPDVAYRYHHVMANVLALQYQVHEWKEQCELYVAAAQEKRSEGDLLLAFQNVADMALHIGQRQIAESSFAEAMTVALRSGIAASIGLVASNYAYERFLAGDLDTSRVLGREGHVRHAHLSIRGLFPRRRCDRAGPRARGRRAVARRAGQ